MARATRTFRIFVSSTFDDLKAERNALQRDCFPRLRELCASNGTRFQAIDLRWGVPSEAALDQRTMSICLGEIDKCREVSPKPNFIVLLGDRYGWRPVPERIEAALFEQICNVLEDDGRDCASLLEWYCRDDNASPPEYCLASREGGFADPRRWSDVEAELHLLLRDGLDRLDIQAPERNQFEASATEQEIEKGALQVEDAREHVFSFFRRITDIEDRDATIFRDLREDGSVDNDAQARLLRLKERLAGTDNVDGVLPAANARRYEIEYTTATGDEPAAQAAYLDRLCADVYDSLSAVILGEIQRLAEIDDLDREVADQWSFARERAQFFTGRAEVLQAIADSLESSDNSPLIVTGPSGSGKSAVIARAVTGLADERQSLTVAARFCGATPGSSDVRSLLQSLCRQLSRAYGIDEADVPNEYQELVNYFQALIGAASETQPLVLFIDALDQLEDGTHEHSHQWLPAVLPDHVSMIVSVLEGDHQQRLARRFPADRFVPLPIMSKKHGADLLDAWMADIGRSLTGAQRKTVLDGFASCPYPLYLKLAFEEAKLWRSYTPAKDTALAADIQGLIDQLFDRLSDAANHGACLTRRALSYLVCAKNGLTEDELIEILSRDDEVWQEFLERSIDTPSARQLPAAVWSRFYLDLEPYLTERNDDGTWLLGFYHRQLREAAESRYLGSDERRTTHAVLADYFSEPPLFFDDNGSGIPGDRTGVDSDRVPNLRKMSELPYQQALAGDRPKALYDTLTDLDFQEAKCSFVDVSQGSGEEAGLTYGGVYALRSDFERALESEPGEHAYRQWHDFLRAQSHILARYPDLLTQQAANYSPDSVPARLANEQIQSGRFDRPWLKLLNPEPYLDPCVETIQPRLSVAPERATLETPDLLRVRPTQPQIGIHACSVAPRAGLIASGSEDCTLRLWDAASALPVAVLPHPAAVWACAFSRREDRIASGGFDCAVRIWDVSSGELLMTLTGHESTVTGVAFSPDQQVIASCSWDKTIRIWDARSGAPLGVLGEHEGHVNNVIFGPRRELITSASQDGTAVQWFWRTRSAGGNLETHDRDVKDCAYSPDGRLTATVADWSNLRIYETGSGSLLYDYDIGVSPTCCTFSPDSKAVLVGTGPSGLMLIDIEAGTLRGSYVGHTHVVSGCAFIDERTFVSASMDGTLRIWDVERGQKAAEEQVDWMSAIADRCRFSSDGTRFVSASWTTTSVWDSSSHEKLMNASEIQPYSFSPDGAEIVGRNSKNEMRLIDSRSGATIMEYPGHELEIFGCSFSSDGEYLLSFGGDGSVRVWRAHTGEEVARYLAGIDDTTVPRIPIFAAFVEDRVLAGYVEGSIIEWRPQAGQELLDLGRPLRKFAASNNGDVGVALPPLPYVDMYAFLFTLGPGEPSSTKLPHDAAILDCDISPDGRSVATASADGRVRIWDVASSALRHELVGHRKEVTGCIWSPDSSSLLSGSLDGTLRLWSETGDALGTLTADIALVNEKKVHEQRLDRFLQRGPFDWCPDSRSFVFFDGAKAMQHVRPCSVEAHPLLD